MAKKAKSAFFYFNLKDKNLIVQKKHSKVSHFFWNKKNLYRPNLL